MAIREIFTYPNPVLRERANPVESFDGELKELVSDMVETMYDAPGVGLAATQVGVPLRVCVIDTSVGEEEGNLHVLVNPEIVEREGEIMSEEGCLSVPGFLAEIPRSARVVVRFADEEGKPRELEGTELLARAIQHELDHLNGVLFVDHLGIIKKERFKRAYRKILAEA